MSNHREKWRQRRKMKERARFDQSEREEVRSTMTKTDLKEWEGRNDVPRYSNKENP